MNPSFLVGIIEHFYHHHIDFNNNYTLFIDEVHLLDKHESLIEICRSDYATESDIFCLSVFEEYKKINSLTDIIYYRTIYLYIQF